jgi:hypothetical protein
VPLSTDVAAACPPASWKVWASTSHWRADDASAPEPSWIAKPSGVGSKTAVRQQRVAQRVGLGLAVEVVAGGERTRRADALVEAQEGVGLRIGGAAVGPEGVAEVGPVAVRVDPVAVVALEEDAAGLHAPAPPAAGVGIGEVDDRLLEHVGEGRSARAHRGGDDRPVGQAGVIGGDEVLHRPCAALRAGALDAVDRERERVALLAGVGHRLVGDADDDEVALLARERRGRQRPAETYSGLGEYSSEPRLSPGNIAVGFACTCALVCEPSPILPSRTSTSRASTNSSTPMKLLAGIVPCARGEQIGELTVMHPASGSGKTRPKVMYCWSDVATGEAAAGAASSTAAARARTAARACMKAATPCPSRTCPNRCLPSGR